MKNIKGLIGNTPIIKIKYKYKGIENYIYVKLEYYNLTGSIKDRMVYYILDKAIKEGELKDDMVLVEATSGNTGISFAAFLAFNEHYSEQLDKFREDVYNHSYKNIRDNKKLHFWMNSGTIKVSTINSFKGWESEVVFLILEPKYDITTSFNLSFDELLYTGLTRCRQNLVIINFGNEEYDNKIRPIIEQVNTQ